MDAKPFSSTRATVLIARFRQARNSFLVLLVSAGIMVIYGADLIPRMEIASEAKAKSHVTLARLSDEVSIRAAGRGNPWINLSDGRELITPYSGPAELTRVLEQNDAQPLSLCSADFDEDGVPDLISGYAGPEGGIVTLLRGNVDSIYPNSPEAKQRKAEGSLTDAPFLSPAFVFSVPEAVDFIGAGDFDGDSHWDVVTAKRASRKLHLLSGDGRGGLRGTTDVQLPGGVTALTVGEINRRDGLDDVVVGVSGEEGPQVLVYEGPEGALRAIPETFDLPAEAVSFALGQLDEEYTMDLAVAAGRDLLVVHGRDRKLSLDEIRQAEVSSARVSKQSFSVQLRSVAVGDFSGRHTTEMALLSEDGVVHVLSRTHAQVKKHKASLTVREWNREIPAVGYGSDAVQLVSERLSSMPVDNLLIVDLKSHHTQILAAGEEGGGRVGAEKIATASDRGISTLLDGQVASVLPMRLNQDALSDLIVLRPNQSGAIVAMTLAPTTLIVTNTNDSGSGSLRQAIIDANSNPGTDTIIFSIGSGAKTITPESLLPEVTGPVTIDGTTQAGFAGVPIIEIDGSHAGPDGDGLIISAGNSIIRGLVINRFSRAGIVLRTQGFNRIEGNFLGTDVTGTTAMSNNRNGVFIEDTPSNTVGGTTGSARNVISGNIFQGIFIGGPNGTNNRVQGNYIGTDVSAGRAVANVSAGIGIGSSATNNIVGGAMAAAHNVISGNGGAGGFSGVVLGGTNNMGNLVQGNFIGTDPTGTVAIGNFNEGIFVFNRASNNLIGGTTIGTRNIISGNRLYGIQISVSGSTGNRIQGNLIGTDISGTERLGNGDGVLVNGSISNTIGGVTGAGNVISGNSGHGVFILGNAEGNAMGNHVQGNYIGTDVSGTKGLGNSLNGLNITNAPGNTVGGMTAGARNIISSNGGAGIGVGFRGKDPSTGDEFFGQTGAALLGNYIGTDVTASRALGNGMDGVFVEVNSTVNRIENNIIAFNGGNGIRVPSLSSNPGVPGIKIAISSNSIYSNAELGIELGNDGPTPNDPVPGDPDSGANDLQNFPILNPVAPSSGLSTNLMVFGAISTTIAGTFNSTPNSTFTLEFFFGTNCQESGSQFTGFIPIKLGAMQVTTDGNGDSIPNPFAFTFDFPSATSGGYVNCTATSLTGNTSEFSQCLAVTNPNAPRITAAPFREGKHLIVAGENFESGAKILVNGQDRKTIFASTVRLKGKKLYKQLPAAQTVTIQVRNPDGATSNAMSYTKPGG